MKRRKKVIKPIIGKKKAARKRAAQNGSVVVSMINGFIGEGLRTVSSINVDHLGTLINMVKEDYSEITGQTITDDQAKTIVEALLSEGPVDESVYEASLKEAAKFYKSAMRKKASGFSVEVFIGKASDPTVGKWVDLTDVDEVDLEEIIDEITDEGAGDYIIADVQITGIPSKELTDALIHEISGYGDVMELLGLIDQILDEDELERVAYLVWRGWDLEEAIKLADEVYVYHNMSLGDVAYEMYEEGLFGEKCEYLEIYVDWDQFGKELEINGECDEIDGNVYCYNG